MLPVSRLSGGRVSGTRHQADTSSSRPNSARTTNTPRQSVKARIQLPICGANTGPTPVASMRVAKNRARATPECRSRTMDRAITMPAAPPMPWIRRKPVRK